MSTQVTPTRSSAKQDRFSIRASTEEKALVERAAEVSRMSMSQFVIQAAVRSAETALADQTRFTLAPDQWAAFTDALDRPAREIAELKAAAAKESPFSGR